MELVFCNQHLRDQLTYEPVVLALIIAGVQKLVEGPPVQGDDAHLSTRAPLHEVSRRADAAGRSASTYRQLPAQAGKEQHGATPIVPTWGASSGPKP